MELNIHKTGVSPVFVDRSLDHGLPAPGSHLLTVKWKPLSSNMAMDSSGRLTSQTTKGDFHCEHFAVLIHRVVHHLAHSPNFEHLASLLIEGPNLASMSAVLAESREWHNFLGHTCT